MEDGDEGVIGRRSVERAAARSSLDRLTIGDYNPLQHSSGLLNHLPLLGDKLTSINPNPKTRTSDPLNPISRKGKGKGKGGVSSGDGRCKSR
ncbi:unnamed protein product [Discosporangium mesarthrocarpum]